MVSKWIEKVVARFSKPVPPAPPKADMPITLEKFAKLHDGGVVSKAVLDDLLSRDRILAPLPYVVPESSRAAAGIELLGTKDEGVSVTFRADSFKIVDPKPLARIVTVESDEDAMVEQIKAEKLAQAQAIIRKAQAEDILRKMEDEGKITSPVHRKLAEELLEHAEDEFRRLLLGDPDTKPRSFAGLEPLAPPVRGNYADTAEF